MVFRLNRGLMVWWKGSGHCVFVQWGTGIIKVQIAELVLSVSRQINHLKDFYLVYPPPARNALINAGITELEHLDEYTEKEILQLHGIGPSSLPTLKHAMAEKNVNFKS